MKNIHILPTDKPSKLYLIKDKLKLSPLKFTNDEELGWLTQNIYITNSEEIKKGDLKVGEYYLYFNKVRQFKEIDKLNRAWKDYKKIILTTDPDLIKNGIQAIDDDFLEWFVNNSSCEFVNLENHVLEIGYNLYKIIIPQEEPKHIIQKVATHLGKTIPETLKHIENFSKELDKLKEEPKQETKCYCGHTTYCDCGPLEEPKQEMAGKAFYESADKVITVTRQETLEEAAERIYDDNLFDYEKYRYGFIAGAKWKEERSYSEEDMIEFAEWIANSKLHGYSKQLYEAMIIYKVKTTKDLLKEWFEQYKKK